MKSLLQKSDHEGRKTCWDIECPICLTKGEGKCSKENAGYEIWCKECEEIKDRAAMQGETGRNARERCKEHMRSLRNKKNSNLWEHSRDVHEGRDVEYGCRVTGTFGRDILARQLDEALRIEEEWGVSLNDKNEWIRPAGYTVNIERM